MIQENAHGEQTRGQASAGFVPAAPSLQVVSRRAVRREGLRVCQTTRQSLRPLPSLRPLHFLSHRPLHFLHSHPSLPVAGRHPHPKQGLAPETTAASL